MNDIHTPTFSEADVYVIENTDREILAASIEFLKTYKEVMWLDNDTGEVVTHSELRRRKVHIQPRPQYPEELTKLGKMFWSMMWYEKEFRITQQGLREAGFFTENSLASCLLGTMFSPSLIASLICDSFVRERYCGGLFGFGVENGFYLKMLLRLEDAIHYYDYMKIASFDTQLP